MPSRDSPVAEIILKNLVKRFAGTTAVNNANFTINDGEFFILVGPSGCGKSTLLNMIVGLESVTEGEILLDGKQVNDLDPRERNMAMVFQSYAIYPHMSVRENMSFPLKLAKLSQQEIDERVAWAAKTLEIEHLLDRKPGALSGGQRQRVAMGRAIVRKPSVFLLDEPLSNLDAKLRVQMRTEIARLQQRLGTTTVYVTHDQTEAMTLGDRIAVMRKGEILQIGTPRELYKYPQNLFVAGFIGSPPMNFLPARRNGQHLELPIGTYSLSDDQYKCLQNIDNNLVTGFRPEHLRLATTNNVPEDALRIEAQVDIMEWLGADLIIYFDTALDDFAEPDLPQDLEIRTGNNSRRSLLARIDPGSGVKEGDTVHLYLPYKDIQIFNEQSGNNVKYRC